MINSEVIKDYPELKQVLETREKVRARDLENLSPQVKAIVDQMLPKIIKQAETEWAAEKDFHDFGETGVTCSLCNTPNRYIHYITNRLNGTSLNVGSDCVTHFDFDFGLPQGITIEQYQRMQHQTRKELLNLQELNKRFPGADRLVNQWRDEYEAHPLFLTRSLRDRFQACCKRADSVVNRIKKGKLKGEDGYTELERVIAEYDQLRQDINDFIRKSRERKQAVTMKVYRWLVENNSTGANYLNNKGIPKIDENIYWQIQERDFVLSTLDDLNRALVGTPLEIAGTDFDRLSFRLDYRRKEVKLLLQCPMRLVMRICAPYVFRRTQIGPNDTDSILSRCLPANEKSFDGLIYLLSKAFLAKGIKFGYADYAAGDLIVLDSSRSQFVVFNAKEFFLKYQGLVLKSVPPNLDTCVAEVLGTKKGRYPMSEYKDYLQRHYHISLKSL
ncbi:MAG: hypothetical protein C4575_12725 [Desulforudis sp.]|jgi:hypothetical protein|nr:MAG: hypothetical protein C4575_12725 [Desulforudis sp.]